MNVEWIVPASIAVVALVALTVALWRQIRRVRKLRRSHSRTIEKKEAEHRRRVDRIDREHHRRLQAAHHPLVEDLLPVIDGLDEAAEQLADADDAHNSASEVEQGLKMARNGLYDALSRHDVTPIAPDPATPFDPQIHEAISRTEDPEAEPGTIRTCFRRGFRDGDLVIRPAMVEVNTAPSDADDDVGDDSTGESADDL